MTPTIPQRAAGIGIVVMLIALGAALIARADSGSSPAKYAFDGALRALESGDIAMGKPLPPSVNLGRPITDVEREDDDERTFGLLVYSHDYRILLLYRRDGLVFAAQLIEGVRRSKEKWFFCDDAILSKYIALAIRVPDPMEQFKKENPGAEITEKPRK